MYIQNKVRIMKVNKRYILIRIITLPFKLLFTVVWFLCMAVFSNWKWVLYGGQEIYYSKTDNRDSIWDLMKSNKELIEELNKNKYGL